MTASISARTIEALTAIATGLHDIADAVRETGRTGEGQEGVQEAADTECSCAACDPGMVLDGWASRMSVCPDCGNKRCPKAANHAKWQCSGSNETGQQGVPVAAGEPGVGSAGRGASEGLGGRLRALIPDTYADDGYFGVTALEIGEFADEADELQAAYRVADAEIARLSEFHDHYRDQVERVRAQLVRMTKSSDEKTRRHGNALLQILDGTDAP